jgi:hypothetical protein
MRTPTSDARAGSETATTINPQRSLRIVEFEDVIAAKEDTKEVRTLKRQNGNGTKNDVQQ